MSRSRRAAATPALALLAQLGVEHTVHRYEHDRGTASYGTEAAERLGDVAGSDRIFKTLVVRSDARELATAMIPVSRTLRLKRLAAVLGATSVELADPARVTRTTGYVLGGVSPLGMRVALATVLDDSALCARTIFCSAGRRGLEVELRPQDLIEILDARVASIAAD